MKNNLFKSIVGMATVLLVQTASAGIDKGNGGDAWVCFANATSKNLVQLNINYNVGKELPLDPLSQLDVKKDIVSVELLDLYEAENIFGRQLLKFTGKTEKEIISERMNALKQKTSYPYQLAEIADSMKWIPVKNGVLAVDDENLGYISDETNCLPMQIANRVHMGGARTQVKYDTRLFNLMSERDKAALRIHEWSYSIAYLIGLRSSSQVRDFVGLLFSDDLSKMDSADLLTYLDESKIALTATTVSPIRNTFKRYFWQADIVDVLDVPVEVLIGQGAQARVYGSYGLRKRVKTILEARLYYEAYSNTAMASDTPKLLVDPVAAPMESLCRGVVESYMGDYPNIVGFAFTQTVKCPILGVEAKYYRCTDYRCNTVTLGIETPQTINGVTCHEADEVTNNPILQKVGAKYIVSSCSLAEPHLYVDGVGQTLTLNPAKKDLKNPYMVSVGNIAFYPSGKVKYFFTGQTMQIQGHTFQPGNQISFTEDGLLRSPF